ncbi:hypothetical protein [Tranquillimonas alkanivorans]|uniref:PRC-barrel domain-containing protein n=1 Tax=Tranquillimonas alkanivorans TaxID=441119 RepID=A0A1I5R9H0_9RHOB|nr:hypothetical protein [Tranquillimonas alkanivorans]SFP55133.1 hypothetical protein SAMN04488047_10861 [Tranquillimonas alkanivorans]
MHLPLAATALLFALALPLSAQDTAGPATELEAEPDVPAEEIAAARNGAPVYTSDGEAVGTVDGQNALGLTVRLDEPLEDGMDTIIVRSDMEAAADGSVTLPMTRKVFLERAAVDGKVED